MKVRTLNGEEVTAWQITTEPGHVNLIGRGMELQQDGDSFCYFVHTVSNVVKAHPGDWIISAPYDGLSVMSAAEFEKAFGGGA